MTALNHKLALGDKYLKPAFWRALLIFWTFVVFAAIIWDFDTDNGLTNLLGPLMAIYVGILSIYSAEKEFRRWYSLHSGRHPGELYVIAWTLMVVSIFIADILVESAYTIPEAIVSTYIVVVGILAITKSSKRAFLEKKKRTTV
ncbi:MAG: hypothetical protein PHV43_02670 [Candidatus Colwellbacteria bacterium]|nr:hypothetical protein [Candidatus Colwellbacteria bacterium]